MYALASASKADFPGLWYPLTTNLALAKDKFSVRGRSKRWWRQFFSSLDEEYCRLDDYRLEEGGGEFATTVLKYWESAGDRPDLSVETSAIGGLTQPATGPPGPCLGLCFVVL